MGRFVLVVLVAVGIGYGGWSLVRPAESPAPPLSGGVADGASGGEGGSSGAEPAGNDAGVLADAGGSDVTALRAAAVAAEEAAREAPTREAALESKDEARRLYSRAFFAEVDPESAAALRTDVDRLNEQVLFSEQPLPGRAFLHTFGATDRLWTLCYKQWPTERDLRIEPGFLLWVNGQQDPRLIREGQVLKVPTEELSLLVSKSKFRLWVLLGGVYIREYPIGIGVNDKTPEGDFVIDTKLENPPWYFEGKKIAFGHPDNPLGTRWMGFKRTPTASGYGIHGTKEPGSVGKAVSQGCIRMENGDVEELFEWVARKTQVRIVR